MKRTRLLSLALGLAAGAAAFAAPAESTLPQFTEALAIRRLTLEQAQRQFPVHLRGVVTYNDNFALSSYPGVVIQDATAGIYVLLPRPMELPPGEDVELDGTTSVGGFGPLVRASRCVSLGRGALPAAKPVQIESISSGQEDAQWVEVRGMVRSVFDADRRGAYLSLLLAGGGRLQCLVVGAKAGTAASLVGARVRVTGACLSRFNQSRQISTPWLGVASPGQVAVEQPASPEPPLGSVQNLMRFTADATGGGRVRVRGVVTAIDRGRLLVIQEGATGLIVQTAAPPSAGIGDEVDVLGFPVPGVFRPTLEDGILRRTGRTLAPVVTAITPDEALTGRHDADLVRIRGTLINRVKRDRGQLLAIDSRAGAFSAFLREGDAAGLDRAANGSVVELTGICLMDKGEDPVRVTSAIPSFQLWLRSGADVTVLAPPRWWTLQKLLWIVALLLAVIFSIAAWVVVLERRVRRQTEIIRGKVEMEAIAEERNRLAREFHDTLEQELAAITLQLDAVGTQLDHAPIRARQLLQLAQSMARRSFSEVRRTVWDLRSRFLETNDLPTALAEAVKPPDTAAAVFPRVEVQGPVRPLPPRVETQLLRIGQEAVNNAVKHASARNIVVTLAYRETGARLSVRDDGRGFAATEANSAGGHFGLVDMRERAEKIGSKLEVRSARDQGTEIAVDVAASPP